MRVLFLSGVALFLGGLGDKKVGFEVSGFCGFTVISSGKVGFRGAELLRCRT